MSSVGSVLRLGTAALILLLFLSCEAPREGEMAPGQESGGNPVLLGQPAHVLLDNDTMGSGLAVAVIRSDGSKVAGVFRGPAKLLDVATQGTYRFSADSLPARVRALRPGERLIRTPE